MYLSNTINKFPHILAIALALILCSCNDQYSTPQNSRNGATQTFNKSTPSPMKWPKHALGDKGLSIYVSRDLIDEFSPADYNGDLNPVQQMLEEWNKSNPSSKLFNTESASDLNSIPSDQKASLVDYNDSVFAIYKHDDWFEDISSSALAITQFFGKRMNSGSSNEYLELIHADIIINYRYFEFEVGVKSYDTYDLPSVILHELGHFLGLNHTSYYENSVMVPYLDVGTEKRSLYDFDKLTIEDLYGSSNTSLNTARKSLSATSNLATSRFSKIDPNHAPEPEYVSGIIELQASGDCVHYIDGKEVHRH